MYNLAVSFSKLLGIPVVLAASGVADVTVVILVMVTSTLMHLSERKHSLPGIPPFHDMCDFLLNLDRCMAVSAFIYFLPRITWDIFFQNLSVCLLGLLSIFVSENMEVSPLFFTIWHTIWHACVYRMLYCLVSISGQ